MNVGFITMNNLQLPKKQRTESSNKQSKGLLSRGSKPQFENKVADEPRDRVASYVATLRQARMDLRNG